MPRWESQIRPLIDAVRDWARRRADIVAVALVGSHARAAARPDSDVDFVILTAAPAAYRGDAAWPAQITWPAGAAVRPGWVDVTYGALWARHLTLTDGTRVEVGFAAPSWAHPAPVNPGTLSVVRGGCEAVRDPENRLGALRRAVAELPSAAV